MIVHHDRTVTSGFAVSYCGRSSIIEPASEEAVLESQSESSKSNALREGERHCTRCLYSKRKAKGDAYMREHGYPLIKRTRFPGSMAGYYEEEV